MASTIHRRTLSLKEKIDLIEFSEKHKMGVCALANEFKVGRTQICNILKQRELWRKEWLKNGNQERKNKFPKTDGLAVDTVVYKWFTSARSKNLPISGPILQEKAREIAEQMGLTNFKASNGWLDRFRVRHEIVFKKVCGESADVDDNVCEEWTKKLPLVMEGYSSRDIYNIDETGLYYRALPDKTLTLKKEKCSGGKTAKERLTVLLGANMKGEKLTPLVIGKAAKPRCFKGLDTRKLPVEWDHNKKVWMTTDIMSRYLMQLDKNFGKEKRKVLFFMDNATSHPTDIRLKNIKIVFLPPNTTSKCQPMDLGAIKSFKVHYRMLVLKHLIRKMDVAKSATELAKAINVLDAIGWIKHAWSIVKGETITKCFQKCGMRESEASGSEIDEYEEEGTDFLQELIEEAGFSVSAADYAPIDDNVTTEDQTIEIADIIKDISTESSEED